MNYCCPASERDRLMMSVAQVETKNLNACAVVIIWAVLSLTWTAARAQDVNGRQQQASGNVNSASRPAAGVDSGDAAKIGQYIAQLGADEFATRDAATKALIKIGEEALEALKKAVENDDPEVSVRAKIALRAIQAEIASRTHRVVDSEGNPLAGIEVRFAVKDPQTGEMTTLGQATSDRRGFLSMTLDGVNAAMGFASISDSRLGKATIPMPLPSQELQMLSFPLVSKGAPAYERALKGQVLDEDAKPVSQAMIYCSTIRTPGEGLISADERSCVLTDDEGQFVIYPVAGQQRREERGKLVPENSRFQLTVRPAKESGLFPAYAEAVNARPASIVLERPRHEHTFKLEKSDGSLAGGDDLQSAYITYSKQPRQGRIVLERSLIQEGGGLLPGFYTARMDNLEYLPLEVKDDSPGELVFRLSAGCTYRGKIVDGKTGMPIEGAFVIAVTAVAYNNFAALTNDEWDNLEKLPSQAPMDLPIIARLQAMYSFHGVVRTDAEGGYEINGPRGRTTYSLIAFARDRMPYFCRTHDLKAGDDGKTHAPDMPLYPAAKVLVRPLFEKGHISIAYYWSVEGEGDAAWVSALRGPRWPSEKGFARLNWLKVNEQQPLYVPAGARLKVMFDTPYDEQWTAINPQETLLLNTEQTKDLGDLKFAPSAKVEASVMDENGKPMEGVPLRKMRTGQNEDEKTWSVAHNTDAEGKATFHAPACSSGKIAIVDFPRGNSAAKAPNVTVNFQVDKDGKQIEPCVIRLTAEQIQLLLGK
jgi:hypothetical protein